MSSPRKHPKAIEYQGRKLHEPALPLHLALAWVIIRVFPINLDYQYLSDVYSPGFTHQILQILAREVLEVGSQPATFVSLREETDKLLHDELPQVIKRNEKKRARGLELDLEYEKAEKGESWLGELAERFKDVSEGCTFIDSLEKELRERLNFSEDDDAKNPPPMDRHSPLGVFFRNLINIHRKLSFDETAHLARQIALWCGVDHSGPSRPVTMWSLDRRSGMEDSLDKRMKSMQDYRAASSSGDYSGALASLRSFYDYQSPHAGRGQHQHALLNIATFHYASNGLDSARSAIDEAIRVARTAGDKECLQHCMSLSRRLQTETNSVAFTSTETIKIHQTPIPLSRLPEAATPMDELWSIKAALDLGEPVHVAFRRVYAALGLENQKTLPPESTGTEDADRPYAKQWPTAQKLDFAAWHAAQSSLWGMMGSRALLELHEELAEGDVDGGTDGRLSVVFAQAQRATESGDYDDALAQLIDLSTLRGMSMSAYHCWARVLWALLERRAQFNNDPDTLSYIAALSPSSPLSQVGPGGPPRTSAHPSPISIEGPPDPNSDLSSPVALTQSHILSSLRHASSLLSAPSPALPHQILPSILSSLTLASSLSLWKMYRFAIVLLAETMLLMEGVPMAGKVVNEVECIWAQLVNDGDAEGVMRGAGVLGRAWIELSLKSRVDEEHDKAVEYLLLSQQHAQRLEHRAACLETSSLLAMLAALRSNGHFPKSKFQSHDNEQVQEELVQRYWEVKEGQGDGPSIGGIKRVADIGEIVKWVGVRIAEGWQWSG
ncbi:hypothetical protein L202_02819 [Cryptococcus amylolentus CBS 6039]|uniref:Anaphase-promoting complex subunit 5 n=1 Tax=Cryptococcus amylolentus CBS 6039 TaxID=1295533 RepID=A0A1E3HWU1_9TREE|nr:hypothetical protein L202_02819 [Cryptococcus amylolentus CBS 6039]ODN80635.1 hypothetical protein L202_02819 [Cryptococcus amylolentus CBS 6039]